jgi:hypothetical protein
MTQGIYSVLATHLRMVLRWLEAQGEQAQEHFERHGLDINVLQQPRERLPAAGLMRYWLICEIAFNVRAWVQNSLNFIV